MDKIAIYPIIITKDDDGDYPYYVEIPDLGGEKVTHHPQLFK